MPASLLPPVRRSRSRLLPGPAAPDGQLWPHRRGPRFIIYSSLFPSTLWDGLRRRGARVATGSQWYGA